MEKSPPTLQPQGGRVTPENCFNREGGSPFFKPRIQLKLKVNKPGDEFEQEADAMADKVMRKKADTSDYFFSPATEIQRKCTRCQEDDKPVQRSSTFIQRKEIEDEVDVSDWMSQQVESEKGSGHTLDSRTRGFMESGLDAGFEKVRIHTDAAAIKMNNDINARAFTTGNDIYFNEGEYKPTSFEGKHLLAHELTHTIQQTGTIQRKTNCDYEKFQQEITGVGEEAKYLKATPATGADNFQGVPVQDGDVAVLKNEGGAATYNNVKNCTWAWIEIPGKKSTDKSYPVLHGFIETKYLKSKEAKQAETKKEVPVSKVLGNMDGPEIIYANGSFQYTVNALLPLAPPVDFSAVKWGFKYDSGEIKVLDTSTGLTKADSSVTLNVFIPPDIKATKFTLYAYTSTPEDGSSKESSLQSVSIVESKKDKGKNADGTVADDMKFKDFTPKQIQDIGYLFQLDSLSGFTDDQLFGHLTKMATDLFSVGDLETNALAMIAHFRSNTGTDYSNPILTKAVSEHEATSRFITHIKMVLSAKVLAEKEGLHAAPVTKGEIEKYRPVFNSTSDTFAGGLTFAINDTWAYKTEILYYDYVSDTSFKGKLRVTIYDDFGLDKPDVVKKFGYLIGFRSWFVLQHERGYKPFLTVVEMEVPFDESITAIEPAMKAAEQAAKDRAELEKKFRTPPGGAKY